MTANLNPLGLAWCDRMVGGKRFHGRAAWHEAERMAGRDAGGDA